MKTESLCAEGALAVRRFREGDLPELAALLADPEVMRWLEPPFDRARAAGFLRVAGLSEPPLIYAAEEDGAFLGYVIFHRYGGEEAAELGWVLRRSAWGRGYAGRLTALLLSAAEGKWAEAVIECAPEQRASARVAEKLGFREEEMRTVGRLICQAAQADFEDKIDSLRAQVKELTRKYPLYQGQ